MMAGTSRMPSGEEVERLENRIQKFTRNKLKTEFSDSSPRDNSIKKKNIDGGYAWVVVFASFFIQFIGDGVAYTFGMFFVEITKEYPQVGKSGSSWIASIMSATTHGVGGPVASILVNKFGARTVSIMGSLIAMSGFSLSYYATHPAIMYCTVGILGGLGFGFMYLPAIVSVPKYFDKKRAFAMGICVAGSGSGTLFFEWALDLILANFEWREGVLITAGIITISLPLAFFYRPSDDPVRPSLSRENSGINLDMTDAVSTNESTTKKNSCLRSLIDLGLLENLSFLLFSTSDILTSIGFNVPYVYLPEIEQKLTNSTTTTTLGFMGGANVLSRIILGYFSDKEFVNRRYLYIFALTTAGISTAISPHLTSLTLLRSYATVYGICGGIYVSLKSILLVDLLGLDKLNDAFGLLSLLQGLGFIMGSPSVGFLYDQFKTYNNGFYFAGFMMFISGAILMGIPHTKALMEKRERKATQLPEVGRDNIAFSHYPNFNKDFNPDASNGVTLQSYKSHTEHY